MSRYVILDRDAMLAEMARSDRTSVLVVGNHVEPEPIVPLESEFVIVFANNHKHNKVDPSRVDMVACAVHVPPESARMDAPHIWTIMYPCSMDSFAELERERIYLLDNMLMKSCHDALGMIHYEFPPTPTSGFVITRALDEFKVSARLSGFSFYNANRVEIDHRSSTAMMAAHIPDREREAILKMVRENPLLTVTPEVDKYLRKAQP